MGNFLKRTITCVTSCAICLLSSCRPSEALTDAYYDSFFSQFFNQDDNEGQKPETNEPDNGIPDNRNNNDDDNRQHGNNGHRSNFWGSIFPPENDSEDWVAI